MTTTAIQEYSATEAALAGLAETYKGVVYDVTTKEGMSAAKAGRNEIRGYRTALEAKRVEIKAPALEKCRLIDAEAKRITAELSALEDPIAAQIKLEEDRIQAIKDAEEAALRARVAAIQASMDQIREMPVAVFGESSEALKGYIERLEARVINEEDFGDFVADAAHLKDATLAKLKEILATQLNNEAETARLAAERAELEKQQAAERERIAAENAKRDEEEKRRRLKLEEEERQSRARIEQQERESRAMLDEEARIARAAREADEAKQREIEEQKRLERVAEEEKQREIQRIENQKLDGREMLMAFTDQYGEVVEFKSVVSAISSYFAGLTKAA